MKSLFKYIKPKNRTFEFFAFILFFAISLSTIIYLREKEVKDQISYFSVITWQIGIWVPWSFFFFLFDKIIYRQWFNKISVLIIGLIWIGIHFGWFFFLSSFFSPYLGYPATRYGVYPYFFIFWTVLDIILFWNVQKTIRTQKRLINDSHLFKFELKRGDKTFYCDEEQIYWISAENFYTKFYTEFGPFLVRKPMKEILKILSQNNFKQIHRSTIVNIHYLLGFEKTKNNNMEVILKDGTRRRVSRNFTKETKRIFKNKS